MKDIWTYLRECWNAGIKFRQRVNAVIGLISALVAAPLLWFLRGQIVPDIYLVAAVITAWAIISVFIYAPYSLWREQRQKITDLEDAAESVEQQKAEKQKQQKRMLQKFYDEGSRLFNEELSHDASETEVSAYVAKFNQWFDETYAWIGEHLGSPALSRFNDLSWYRNASFPHAHGNMRIINILNNLAAFIENLRKMIENPSEWDSLE
jgi:hypothetical protein